MYGSQGKKVFQMLLGIELTYPINRLNIKKEMLSFTKKQKNIHILKSKEANRRRFIKTSKST